MTRAEVARKVVKRIIALIPHMSCQDVGGTHFDYAVKEVEDAMAFADQNPVVLEESGEVTPEQWKHLLSKHPTPAPMVREALEKCIKFFLRTYEKDAEDNAIRANLGVSEWEAFMPKEYHEARAALDAEQPVVDEVFEFHDGIPSDAFSRIIQGIRSSVARGDRLRVVAWKKEP